MNIALEFVILRNVESHAHKAINLSFEPVMVATLLNEQRFIDTGHAIIHRDTVFLEDRMHDWSYRNGEFRFFARKGSVDDVLVVFRLGEAETQIRFCSCCGKKIAECECQPAQVEE